MTLIERLFRPVDNSPLIFFRIIYGLLLCLEAWGAIATGWVRKAFIEPQHTFPFIDFSWLEPLPGSGMYFYYVVMGGLGIMVMLGYRYRLAMGAYAIMWAGVYLMQKTHYNNHYYLLMLLNFLMWMVPAHQYASLDARRNPQIKSLTCPQWCIWLFVANMAIVYFYASVAKMYPDWIEAKPIGIWFRAKQHYWLIGPLLAQEWFQHFVAWGGILYDLLIGPGLLWKKTRKYAFIGSVLFHLFNSAVFQVGIFPYLGIAIGVFFFEPEVIRSLFFKNKSSLKDKSIDPYMYPRRPLLMYVLGGYLIIQSLLPLRHWLYPGNVNWTEEGHRLAWHMMLRVKAGYVNFIVVDNDSGDDWNVRPKDYLTDKQARVISSRPDMLWQFVQILKKDFHSRGYDNISIHAQSKVSLNGRPYQPLIDPEYDLAKAEWHRFKPSEWLLLSNENSPSSAEVDP
ncbi:HTTM domain-containing protein [Fulvivirga sp. M361]|uniref:HTTM domain-containing protein n=1 Tax=Fulvivirga sp. M361 TaxID=2594266 RepID=UPI00117ADC7E|nr:HTTM domain-containing protein [Fulvivirga sp. M361]TRX58720.1 HTTM domain-containing protein [Fulvivirga sp. M361]